MIGTNTEKFLPEKRVALLEYIKRSGEATISGLAEHVNTTKEAVRQHLVQLEEDGWVRSIAQSTGSPGRPTHTYSLTLLGDHLFLKNYDSLALQLLEMVIDQGGEVGVKTMLANLTDRQVAQWQQAMQGKSLTERVKTLKGIYFEEDPFTEVEHDEQGMLLVERNCPYYNVAMKYPRMCSVTVSTLTRLLGVKVKREKRFQSNDQRCAFRILADQPINIEEFQFAFEEEL